MIPLTHGYKAIVDNKDFEELSRYNWYMDLTTSGPMRNGGVHMSRQIMNAPNHLEVDHRDGNRLDMQRSNLRLCTSSQNNQNSRKRKGFSSKYKGVSFFPGDKTWRANIAIQGILGQVKLRLGKFTIEEEAARAYDKAARYHFGEFAALNFPKEGERSCL